MCGDGLQDTAGPDHIEQCDDGTANTDHPVCAYNATCTACSTQCLTLFTAAQVRQAIETAIQAEHDAGRQLIAPNPDPSNTNDALALLAHDRPTSLGNHAIVTDVAAPTFFVAGMVGGQGGNCNDGISCGSDDDCASHHCNAQHVCDTPQAPGGSPRFSATRTARVP